MTTEDVQARLESTPVSFYGLALRLRRGASDIVSWSADRGSIRGTLSVGADPTCDWSIRGPGIAPVELWVSAPEGRLRVKSARPGVGAKLDGSVLADGWVTLDPGSRLEFGFACLALEFDAAPLNGGGEAVREMAVSFLGESLASDGDVGSRVPVQSGTVRSSRESSRPIPLERSSREPSRPIPLERPSREPSRPVQHDSVRPAPTARVRSQAAHVPAPKKHGFRYRTRDVLNAFRGHAITSKRTWAVFYGIIGLITLCAYGAFVFLLERL